MFDLWKKEGWFHKSRLRLAVEDVIRGRKRDRRDVLLEKLEFYVWVDVLVECGQCGVVSWCDEALRGHLESVHLALVVGDVSREVCIFVSLLCVSLFNVVLRGTCELKEVDCFCLVVQNHYVWLQCGYT